MPFFTHDREIGGTAMEVQDGLDRLGDKGEIRGSVKIVLPESERILKYHIPAGVIIQGGLVILGRGHVNCAGLTVSGRLMAPETEILGQINPHDALVARAACLAGFNGLGPLLVRDRLEFDGDAVIEGDMTAGEIVAGGQLACQGRLSCHGNIVVQGHLRVQGRIRIGSVADGAQNAIVRGNLNCAWIEASGRLNVGGLFMASASHDEGFSLRVGGSVSAERGISCKGAVEAGLFIRGNRIDGASVVHAGIRARHRPDRRIETMMQPENIGSGEWVDLSRRFEVANALGK
ncbi:hypothetical protein ACEUZ9_005446 [Paracoccus litorisediminis]|uniref:hypothetical protein n=1 Tax=Paracoccus litorisediminis TaxID=2006130 RepID=UPI0037347AD5